MPTVVTEYMAVLRYIRLTKATIHTIIILILIVFPRQNVRRARVSGVLYELYIACLAEYVGFQV